MGWSVCYALSTNETSPFRFNSLYLRQSCPPSHTRMNVIITYACLSINRGRIQDQFALNIIENGVVDQKLWANEWNANFDRVSPYSWRVDIVDRILITITAAMNIHRALFLPGAHTLTHLLRLTGGPCAQGPISPQTTHQKLISGL